MNAAASADLLPGSLPLSLLGAAWAWILAVLLGAVVGRVLRLDRGTASGDAGRHGDRDHDATGDADRRGDRDHDATGDAGARAAAAHAARGRLVEWSVLGIAAQSLAWLGASAAGWLEPHRVLLLATTLTLAAAVVAGRRVAGTVRAAVAPARRADEPPPVDLGRRALHAAALLALVVVVLVAARLALFPTVHYDDLVYHLGLPRQALLTGSWPAMPGFHHSFMPAGWTACYLLPLALGGGSGPQFMNVVALGLLAVVASRLGRHGGGTAAGTAAAALLLASPVFVSLGALAGNDLFVALALATALDRLLETRAERPLAVGLLAGAAWATKYTALAGAVGLAAVATLVAAGRVRRRLGAGGVVLAGTLAVGAAWTWRALHHTGNPVYPAFHSLLGGRWWDGLSGELLAADATKGAVGQRGLAAIGLAAWDLATRSHELGQPGGVALAALVLPALGLLLVAAKRLPAGGTPGAPILALVAFAVAWAGWTATSLNLRYGLFALLALVPLSAAAIEAAMDRLLVRRPGVAPVAASLVLLGLAAGPLMDAVRLHPHLPPGAFWRLDARHPYLTERVAVAAAGRDLAVLLPPPSRLLLVAEARLAPLPHSAVASTAYDPPEIARRLAGARTSDEVTLRLADFTHVLVNERELGRWIRDYRWRERFPGDDWRVLHDWLAGLPEPIGRWGPVSVHELPRGGAGNATLP